MKNHPLEPFHFCPKCGSDDFVVHNELSKHCNHCGFTYYQNPRASTAAFIMNSMGELLIVYPLKDGVSYFDYYITDEGVIKKAVNTTVGRSSNGKRGAFFEPVSEGRADIYTVWLEEPQTNDYRSEVFHVNVDSAKKITYTTEEISPKEFKHIAKRDRPVLNEERLRQ